MREYEKVVKTYTTDKLKKCTCDKCGAICQYDEEEDTDKSTNIAIRPRYTGDTSIKFDLCPKCTRELLNWFPKIKEVKDFEMTLDIWEN